MAWLFWGKKEEPVVEQQSVQQGEMALAWQWISYLQGEVQRLHSNVGVVHAKHSVTAQELPSRIRRDIGQEVAGVLAQKDQESLKRLGQVERLFGDALGVLRGRVDRLESVGERVSAVEAELPKLSSALEALRSRAEQPRSRSSLQERIERKIRSRGKDFLKQSIRSLVQKYGRLSALQLREILVEEQGVCSKSTLYRLLDELEGEFRTSLDGREKVFALPDASGK